MLPFMVLTGAIVAAPMGQLPRPTGSHAVGTTVAYLVDSTRRETSYPSGRPIALQLWYPAGAGEGRVAPYLMEDGLDRLLLAQGYYGVDTAVISGWARLQTHARLDADPDTGRHPLITFSVGLGVIRANYTALAEELASRGYVFALVESPGAGVFLLPDGRVIQDTTNALEEPAAHRAAVEAWSGDVSFVLDHLQRSRAGVAEAAVARTIDWRRVSAAGHSSGGLVAVTTCEHDSRVRACIDLDGGTAAPTGEPIVNFLRTGVGRPTLILRSQPIYSDADFARRGITREAWERGGAGGRAALDSLAARSRGELWIGSVAGTGHFSFTDAPFLMPTTISRFGGRIIDAELGQRVIAAAILAFLDRQLGARGEGLDAVARRFPELTVRRVSPAPRASRS